MPASSESLGFVVAGGRAVVKFLFLIFFPGVSLFVAFIFPMVLYI